tara:strand:- start:12023 stop:13405 length:1383 start_codon:yes stop_codon:yes gene_type:complete
MRKFKIPYYSDSSIYFEKIRHLTWPIFLDSSYQSTMKRNKLVHYDVLTANPFLKVILLDNNEVAVHDLIEKKITHTQKNPLKVLEEIMQNYKIPKNKYPFAGGALGYISYDMNIDNNKKRLIPKMQFGIYDWSIIIDHHKQEAFIITSEFIKDSIAFIKSMSKVFNKNESIKKVFSFTSKIHDNTDKKNYEEKFKVVKDYLQMGDCYQVNLSKKYSVKTEGDPWSFYCKFRQINKSPFMAYLKFDGDTLLSGSPERFLKSNNGKVSTRPIKGTSARGNNADEDEKNIDVLKNSSKERAENLMIVDLLRNDLGVNCKSGSIKVDELFLIESYPNVHHLVSSITGLLKDESSVFDLFNDAFPGGSITGAPKKRAMEIINELEDHARDLYCGSIVYFSFDGKLDSNIAIRSMIHHDDTLHFYSGGGLTIQSSVDDEYKEIEDKVSNIKKTILFFKRRDNAKYK